MIQLPFLIQMQGVYGSMIIAISGLKTFREVDVEPKRRRLLLDDCNDLQNGIWGTGHYPFVHIPSMERKVLTGCVGSNGCYQLVENK